MGTIRNLVNETSIPRHRNLIEALFGMKCENSEESNGRKYIFLNITQDFSFVLHLVVLLKSISSIVKN